MADVVQDEVGAEGSVADNRELIVRFENKIQAALARVWGEEKERMKDEL